MYYEKHRTARRLKLPRRERRVISLCAALIGLFFFMAVNEQAGELIAPAIEAGASSSYTRAVSGAVAEVMADGSFGQPVTLSRAPDGSIAAVETDAKCVNGIKAAVSLAALDALESGCDVPIPIGSLTGLPVLAGCGPEVRLRLRPAGACTSELYSSLEQAGINQTKHTVYCVVTTRMYAMLPGHSVPVELSTRVLIAESVIVGSVPDSYTYVVGDSSDTISRIFDYADRGNK